MLYPMITDDFDQQEVLSGDSDNERIARKKKDKIGRKRKQHELSTSIHKEFRTNFYSDLDNDEFSGETFADLDGLRRFLQQKNQKDNAQTLSEKINIERKLLQTRRNDEKLSRKNTNIDNDEMGNNCNATTEGLFDIIGNSNDKLRLKSKTKMNGKKDSSDFFDDNSHKIINSTSSVSIISFHDLGLSKSLLKAVFETGYQQPTPIQFACIPVVLAGRDICACSSTGTGKTAAFILPILERLLYKSRGRKSITKVLILIPTRELAIQVFQVSRKLAKYTSIEICLAAGGLDIKTQEAALRLGSDIIIATPGRLIDHLHNSPNFSLCDIEVLVLDEADRMLEEQFKDQLKEVIDLCARDRQTMLFSATMTEEVEDLARISLNKPVKLFINENTNMASNLQQEFIRIRNDKHSDDRERKKREAIVAALVTRDFTDHTIIFMRTKYDCKRMNILLGLLGVEIAQLHGGISQVQRIENLYAFKQQKGVKIICATELAARGLDIEGVTTVINMHMPNTPTQYIHRVGRTARAGKVGRSISLIGDRDRKLVKEILKINRESNNSTMPIQRTIPIEIVEEYTRQINNLEPCIEKLLNEEKNERQLKDAEQILRRVEKSSSAEDIKIKMANRKHGGFRKSTRKKGTGD